MPTTRCGCLVASAISDTDNADVFVARIASGRVTRSSSAKISPLQLELLERRLDHEVTVGKIGEVCRERQASERRVALVPGEAALFDATGEVTLDRRAPALPELGLDFAPDRLEPDWTLTWAMPAPIVPSPTTPTFTCESLPLFKPRAEQSDRLPR